MLINGLQMREDTYKLEYDSQSTFRLSLRAKLFQASLFCSRSNFRAMPQSRKRLLRTLTFQCIVPNNFRLKF